MKPFAYARATDAGRRGRAAPPRPDARFLGGGTNLVDLMKLGVETPDLLVDVTPAAARPGSRTRRRRAADRRRRPQQRPRRRPAGPASATRCWPRPCWPARPGSCATWPPSAATCCSAPAAATSRTSPSRATSARPAPAARRRRRAPRPRASSARPSTAWPPTRRTWRSRWPRSTRVVHLRDADGAGDPAGRASTGCPATPRTAETALPPGALITAVVAAAAAACAGRRYRKVRDRASYAFAVGLGRRRPRRRRRHGAGRAARLRRGRARPWRAYEAERALRGGPATEAAFRAAADAELAAARPLPRQRVQGAAGAQPHRGRAGRAGGGGPDDRDRHAVAPAYRIGTATRSPAPRRYAGRVPGGGRRVRLAGAGDGRPRPRRARSTPTRCSRCRACWPCSGTATRRGWPRSPTTSCWCCSATGSPTAASSSRSWSPTAWRRPGKRPPRRRCTSRSSRTTPSCGPTGTTSTRPAKVNAGYESDTEQGDVDGRAGRERGQRRRRRTRPPATHNNPMEPHATHRPLARATGCSCTTPTRARPASRRPWPRCSASAEDRVRVVSAHVGGGFGSKGTRPAQRRARRDGAPGSSAGRCGSR